MTQDQIVDLGEPGMDFVRAHLAIENVLCAALLETVNTRAGQVFTIAPQDATAERLLRFGEGGLLVENIDMSRAIRLPDGGHMLPIITMINQQIAVLKEALISNVGAICLVDDIVPGWNGLLPLLDYNPKAFGVEDQAYHLLTATDDDEAFADVISAANAGWHGVAAVCALAPNVFPSRTSTPADLERVAASVLLLTCVAYDREGFVVWRRMTA